jgi:hypothetical protein
MQSFLNAGYTSEEIELASKMVSGLNLDSDKPDDLRPISEISTDVKTKNSIKPKVIGRGGHKGLIIGLLASLGIVIIALILLYLFQGQIFAV